MRKTQQLKKQLGKALADSRKKAGLSQGEVASRLGYTSPQFISNWERGLSSPPVPTLKKIATMYKVNADKIFTMVMDLTVERTREQLETDFYGKSKR